MLESSPKKDGFQLAPEWSFHKECYLIWPERPDNWRLGENLHKKHTLKSLK